MPFRIFGRLTPELEKHFVTLEERYSKRPVHDDANGIFNHLSLVINNAVPVGCLSGYLDLLKELKPFLPLRIKTSGVIIKDGKHLALSFDRAQTQAVRDLVNTFTHEGVVITYYTKVVWFVPKENQEAAMRELQKVKEMIFNDFILVANRQDDANTIYSSNRYQ